MHSLQMSHSTRLFKVYVRGLGNHHFIETGMEAMAEAASVIVMAAKERSRANGRLRASSDAVTDQRLSRPRR